MAGDQRRERDGGDVAERLAPAVGAGGVHEGHEADDEVADDRGAGLAVVEPDVALGRGELGEVDVERAPGDGHSPGLRDDMVGPDAVRVIDDRDAALELVARPQAGFRVGEHLVGVARGSS